MKLNTMKHRVVTGALLASVALSSFAPAAFAGSGRGRWKNRSAGYPTQRVVVDHRGSSWGPAIAGFIGGVAVGTVLSDRAHANVDVGYSSRSYGGQAYVRDEECYRPSYVYEDPWSGRRFDNLNVFLSYSRSCEGGHWPIARVIDARTGACEQYVCWHDGGWHNYDASDPPWARGYDRGRWSNGGGRWAGNDDWND
jgi:hypothetical protein